VELDVGVPCGSPAMRMMPGQFPQESGAGWGGRQKLGRRETGQNTLHLISSTADAPLAEQR